MRCGGWFVEFGSHMRAKKQRAHMGDGCVQGDFRPPSDYMEQLDRDINAQMRGILIDWIVEVGEMYGLKDQTIFLATNYIDRYVATHIVPRSCLQLVGVTCLQIASKYSESHCPTGDQFAYISVTPIEADSPDPPDP